MKKVLFITYQFPPVASSGVQRNSKHVKYLKEHGWEPIVLTVSTKVKSLFDNDLLNELPQDLKVIRTKILDYSILYRFPLVNKIGVLRKLVDKLYATDLDMLGWVPFAYHAGKKIIKEEKIDLIYSSTFPTSSHVTAYLLAKKFNIPWVIDFPDEIYGNKNYECSKLHKRMIMRFEKVILKKASAVIVAFELIKEGFKKNEQMQQHDKVYELDNGFDPDDFKVEPIESNKNKFTITYVGVFSRFRMPSMFFDSLNELLKEGKIARDKIEIKMVGGIPHEFFESYNLQDVFNFTGYVDHKKAIRHMLGSDALFFFMGANDMVDKNNYRHTGKIFEYLYSQKPIIAVSPIGFSTDLIIRAGNGYIAHPDNKEEIKASLLKAYQDWETGALQNIKAKLEVLKEYEWKNLNFKLVEIFNKVINKSIK